MPEHNGDAEIGGSSSEEVFDVDLECRVSELLDLLWFRVERSPCRVNQGRYHAALRGLRVYLRPEVANQHYVRYHERFKPQEPLVHPRSVREGHGD